MVSTLAFATLLVGLGVSLMLWHVRAWHTAQAATVGPRRLEFEQRRYQRRMRSSLIILVIGGLVFASPWATGPRAIAVLWLAVLGLVGWMLTLAVLDIFASRQFYAAAEGEHDAEKALLLRSLDARVRHRHNGAASDGSHDRPHDSPADG